MFQAYAARSTGMGKLGAAIGEFFNPHIPEEIRDEFLLLSASQLQVQSRLLFLALLLTTPTAALAASQGASFWVRVVTPAAMALFCLLGFLNLNRDLRLSVSPRRAARFLMESTVASSLIAVMCSAWCVHSWLGAPASERIYYPIIIALGAFSTAYCVASARIAAILNLSINLVPMTVLLTTSGSRMDFAVAISLMVAALFQLHMIVKQQGNVVNLLCLQRRARELALSDPLTGLLNRRALLDNALALGREEPLRLLVIDIDHFKAINDGHGHDVGDQVLCEVAERLAIRAEIMGSVARIGGEEFAILGTAAELPEALALAILIDLRTAAMPHGQPLTVSIGIAEGSVGSEDDWRDLFQRADMALYEAKQSGRNRAVHFEASPLPAAKPDRTAAA
ncbi:MAG: diguanylate cyclase [Novosphingobium sp.]|uniref:GGDEF domain-containing protein n=1 Tax=Novosphingobium sp. TaxID=1874826 RepID=UPI0026103E70|nr:diguanylate cyclase [Novosphingobium sp.]MCP5386640.1 diguanylate cyclase [Novosphingobium sp.]